MSGDQSNSWFGDLARQHGPTAIIGACIIYATMQSSDAVTAEKLSTIARDVAQIRDAQVEQGVRLDRVYARSQCQATTVERLSDRAGIRSTCAMQE